MDLMAKASAALRSQRVRAIGIVVMVLVANVVTIFLLAHNRVVLNYDGIFYVTLADFIQQGNLDHPMLDHLGFFYSYLIQSVSSLFHIDLQTGAYLLNAVLFTFFTFAFTSIVRSLGGESRRIVIISVAQITLFAPIAKYKSMIIRDFVYIAFYL